MARRRGTSRPGKRGVARPPATAQPEAPRDPLAHLSPEHRAFALSKRAAEEKLAAGDGEDLSLEELILVLPKYDPRVQAGDCVFDPVAAGEALAFFHEELLLIEGEWAGQPFRLSPWQGAIVANLFGWKRPDGLRRFREMFLEVPRKNGKTPLAAGIVLRVLCHDDEPGAQIYSAAGDKEQAGLLYRHASEMVHRSPDLDRRLVCYRAGKSIVYPALGSFYRILSREARTKHGFNVHAVVVDELHVQQDSHLVETLSSATGSRRQPLVVYITTADFDRPSICNEKEAYALKVADNLIQDPELLPVIYRAERTDPWDAEATWRKANPNYGISVKPDEMKREARKARVSARARNAFLRLRLDVKTSSDVALVDMDLWAKCGAPPILDADVDAWIDELGLEGEVCFGGLDLSAVRDLTTFVLYFPEQHAVLPYFWAPKDTAEDREHQEGVSYTAWASEGWLTLTPGKAIKWRPVKEKLLELQQRFRIREVNFDRWGMGNILEELEAAGFDMVKFGQGYASLSEPTKALERLWLEGELRHGGHPVLAWNAANVMAETDGPDNVKPSKKKSTDRIDGFVALVMAVGGAIAHDAHDPYAEGKFKHL